MSYLPNFYIQICSSIQISNCFLDTWPLSWYPLIHTNHFTVINRCPAATPNHFAAIHLRQNPLVPCGAVFFIFRENLQPDYRPAILHTMHLGTLKTASAVWIWIPRHDLAEMWASRITPLQHRGRNADSVQAATTSKRHFYWNLCTPSFGNRNPV